MTPNTSTGNCAVITTCAAQGVYLIKFPATASTKAFTVADSSNPYTLIVDTTTSGVDPLSLEVWIGTQPAHAGEAMTLTSAYDAAKNAAAAGAAMTLTSGERQSVSGAVWTYSGATSVRPAADYPTIITYLTGTTTIDTVTWRSGKIWTYQYTAGNLTGITEA